MKLESCNSGVYLIKNTVDGKVYVGASSNIHKRWINHKSDLNLGKHHSAKLQDDWILHGESAFKFEIIEPVDNLLHLVAVEQTFIDYYKATEKGYNICPMAGSCLGIRRTRPTGFGHSDETKEKLRAANLGKKQSPETKAKVAQANRDRAPISEATRQKLSNAKLSMSEETKRRISDIKKEWWRKKKMTGGESSTD
jgi:group I intron endonuclease